MRQCRRALLVLASLALPLAARGQGTITIAAGLTASTSVSPSGKLAVPIVVDMSAATGGTNLASLATTVNWGSARLTLDSVKAGAFGVLTSNTTNAPIGSATLTLLSGTGTTATLTFGTMYFTASASSGGTQIVLAPSAAGDGASASVLPLVRARSLAVCVAQSGLWGDVNGSSSVNIIDAQQIARFSVGLSVGNAALVTAQGDVNASGSVNIIDAQQVARFAVGLSAAARVNTAIFIPPTAASVAINQATPVVPIGGSIQLSATPRDASNNDISGCAPVTWSSATPAVATVNSTGFLTGLTAGTSIITASSGAQSAQVTATAIVVAGTLSLNSGNNQFAPTGGTVASPPSVLLVNAASVPISGASVTFAVASGGGSLTGASAVTDAFGVASVGSWTLGASTGNNTLTATTALANVLGNPVTFAATGIPGAAATISVVSGNSQVQTQSTVFVAPLTVLVRDASSNPVNGASVAFAATVGGGNFSGSSTVNVLTGANGQATAPWTAGNVVGTQTATATVGALPAATFNGQSAGPNNGYARCELTSVGAAYCWGDNGHGQIGDGTTTNRNVPTAVGGGVTFATLAEGSADHACGLTAGGQAFCWGANAYGQLGDGTTTDRNAPVAVGGGFTFTQLSVSLNATCGRTSAGALVCWGSSGYGLYGDGVLGTTRLAATTVLAGGQTFSSVALGPQHACAVAASGTMYCWGNNSSGQLGDGTSTNRAVPTALTDGRTYASVAVSDAHSCGLTTAGAAFCWGTGSNGQLGTASTASVAVPTAVTGGLTFASITASSATTCARTAAGASWCWGANASGQVGDGSVTQRTSPNAVFGAVAFASLRARNATTCGRTAAGQPYCWGSNTIGQVGDASVIARLSPVPVVWVEGVAGVAVSMSINSGNNQFATPSAAVAVTPSVLVRDFAGTPVAGASVTFAVASGGGSVTGATIVTNGSGVASVGSWTLGSTSGANTLTASSAGLSVVTFTATAAGAAASVTLVAGDNQVQMLSTAFVAPLTVVVKDASNTPVAGVTVAFSVTVGGGNFAGSTTSNVVTSANGQATAVWTSGGGLGTQTARATVGALAPISFNGRSVGPNNGYARCELTSIGAAFCWGDNTRGQIGDGTTTNRNAPTAVGGGLTFASLADGSADHACGLTSTGVAYCWGSNDWGELGDGSTIERHAPVAVAGGLTFTQLSVSVAATCGRTSAGALVCWGWSGYGLYGDGVQGTVRLTPTAVTAGGQTFASIALGAQHVCAVATGGTLFCWGNNDSGQLADGTNVTRTVPTALTDGRTYGSASVGGSYSCGVTTTGAAFCWGAGGSGQLGTGSSVDVSTPTGVSGGLTFASLSASNSNQTCARTAAGVAYCWGNNGNNQLGDGTTTQRLVPTPVNGGIAFASLRLRSFTSCGRTASGQPYCWGYNGFGQVGDGSVTQRASPVPVNWVEGTLGVPTSMVISAGNGQGATAGSSVPIAPSVLLRDYAGNPVVGATVTFAATLGGGSVAGAVAQTNSSGIATAGGWTLGVALGSNTLVASSTGVPSQTFNATGTTAVASFTLVAGDNQVQAQSNSFIAPLTVVAKDAANNGVPGISVVFTVTGGGGNFSGASQIAVTTDGSGVAAATWTAASTVGAQAATATVTGFASIPFTGRSVTFSNNGYTRCELSSTQAAYCWGDNTFGQVGDGTTVNRSVPTLVGGALSFASLADGKADHACGLTAGGQAYCWGSNAFGQLGDGTTTDRTGPVAVGGGLTFTKLAVSLNASCGLTAGGVMRCWGSAGYGLYGDGVQGAVRLAPTVVSTGGVTFTSIALGRQHVCAVATGGAIYCWGNNVNGQIGDGTFITRTAPAALNDGRTYSSVAAGTSQTCGLTTGGAAFCWGAGASGQLGTGTTASTSTPLAVAGGLTFSAIAASNSSHSCGLTAAGSMYCWGNNGNNQLGDGTPTQRLVPTPVLTSVVFASMSVRNFSSCGRNAAGQPYCWGYNGFGQIGDASFTQRAAPVAVSWIEGVATTAVSLIVNSGNNQTATVGTALAVAPSVIVRDFAGTAVSGVSVTFTVKSGGGSVVTATVLTNASGIATLGSWIVGAGAGQNTLAATAAGLPTVVFTATGQ